ncbi:MAG: flagellar hook-basal body protein [Oscillospiraceae bacterium]|jgi:flagellar basal-body rod protein FlgG|nr:flagellar hook-basal body protein [Oscillospiraceae bacterium]
MFQPLQTGRLGLSGQQRAMDVIGDNIAHLNVTGAKKVRLDFQDTLYTRMFNKVDMGPHMNLQRGTGVRDYQTARDFEQGAMLASERSIDFALEGPGWFVLQNPEPMDEDGLDEFLYTRDGTFYLSTEDNGTFLVDAFGRYVADDAGDRIRIDDPTALVCDEAGYLYISGAGDEGVPFARLGLADFVNPGGLTALGRGYFIQSANSGELVEATAVVHQYYTEDSNVDLSVEMTRMIRTQRAYQIAARCVTTADQMMQVANAIRS